MSAPPDDEPMLTEPREHESPAIDALVDEARSDLQPAIDDARWKAMEERLFARIDDEAPPRRRAWRRPRALEIGAIVLAAAAAVAIVARREPSAERDRSAVVQVDTAAVAGSLRATEGPGEVRVSGVKATQGHVLRAGDLLEADRARAVLERPRRVAWLLESDTAQAARARVKSAGDTLVLGLEDGAIEAQVTPVPAGEAFAVDVATPSSLVRVAVHGTHLRVTRAGTRVVVDLTEGVVSIGAPPRIGTTYGTLVTAPAHVEFDALDLQGTLRVDHAPASVRAAVPLSPDSSIASRPAAPPAPRDVKTAPPHREPDHAIGAVRPPPPRPAHDDPPPIAKVDPTKPPLPPREAIAAAVRQCAASLSRSSDVRVTVTSTLRLKTGASGDVEAAQFDPPLRPEIQACAAQAIYDAKLDAGATVTIPIEFSY
ncbi:MAG: hypothetical protein KF819_26575 [Labilithrix sp.]|nr:hypothetical protein [Labilithrix sp.]